ncbi:MAG: hypothetical protein IPK53_05115 [bacterium]|nr:hypothetical protein [bacterium]MBK8128337.1 hypothetical protein [bacterium]
MGRVLKLADDPRITPVRFESFSDRPVNYFREMVTDPSRAARAAQPPALPQRMRDTESDKRKQNAELDRARAAAFNEGIARGRADAQSELSGAAQLLEQYGTMLQAERSEVAERFEAQLVSLATQMAAKILHAELSVKPDLLLGMVKNAMSMLGDAKQVTVRVSSRDLRMLQQHGEEVKAKLSTSAALEWRADDSLKPGDCMIDSDLGTLDARLDTQLESLKQQLEASLEKKA